MKTFQGNSNLVELERLSKISNAVITQDQGANIDIDDFRYVSPKLNDKEWHQVWAWKQKLGQFGAVLSLNRSSK